MSEAAESLLLELDPPVKVKGGECTSLTLTEPRARHVREAEKQLDDQYSEASVADYEKVLIAACSGVDEEIIKHLTARQVGRAMNFLNAFVGDVYKDADDDALDDLPEGAFEIAIDPPLSWNKISYPTLVLREPLLDEMRRARQFTRQKLTAYTVRARDMELLRLVTGLPPAVIDGLRITTLREATRQLNRFILAGRKAGKA